MVRLYSDLRRHNMGEALADPRSYRGIPKDEWLTPPPVSYTHLDVYKRQTHASCAASIPISS